MKQAVPFVLAAGLLMGTGCMSTHLVKQRAETHSEYSTQEQHYMEVEGEPGYYALLPLTVAGDLATSPFQLGYFLFTDSSHRGTATIYGVPVPLP